MSLLIILIAVFVGVATLVGGVALLLRGESANSAEIRLDQLTGAAPTAAGRDITTEESLLAQALSKERRTAIEEFVTKFLDLRRHLEQADLSITPSKFLAICGAMAGVGFVIPLLTPWKIAAPAGLLLGLLPLGFLWFKRMQRLSAFAKQLPEALELISRALRAGHSLGSGMSLVANEMAAPIGKEFARAYEEQNFGVPLEQTLESLAERVPNLDLRFFVTAVNLQRQTGGDLAEILDKIGYIVRERFKIYGQVQALTGEGRLSGIVLLALPPVLFIVMWRLNSAYVMKLFDDPMGHQMLAVAIVMQVIGALVIRKIVNIKV